ncbi:MAG TPA: DinB family protein [Panacibacter sp.]|nr:DinB family protein [Panacibacter sp.]
MKLTELIAQHITEVHEGGNWTEVNIKDTLADVTYKEATAVTKASYNTIAALLHHLSFYNDIVMQRLSGENPVINEANGFDVPAIKNEEDWAKLKERNHQSGKQLAEAVSRFPEEKVFELTATGHSTHYKTLHGITEHAHYHLGQIVMLKKLARQVKQHAVRSNSL